MIQKRDSPRVNNARLTVRENIESLRTMNYRQIYALAKEHRITGHGHSFLAFKDELKTCGVDYDALKYKTLCDEWAENEKERKRRGGTRPFLHPDEKERRARERMK